MTYEELLPYRYARYTWFVISTKLVNSIKPKVRQWDRNRLFLARIEDIDPPSGKFRGAVKMGYYDKNYKYRFLTMAFEHVVRKANPKDLEEYGVSP